VAEFSKQHSAKPYFTRFWPRNVVKRGICYQNVCAVRLSVLRLREVMKESKTDRPT